MDQVIPKLTEKTKVDVVKVIETLRNKEKGSFFNRGETKYIEVNNALLSLKTLKCLNMMTGDNKKEESSQGKLLPETQVDVKTAPGSLLQS